MMKQPETAPFHGVLNIYKESGYTSGDVVNKLRRILHMRKIGHTGTLDPAAEGVLPVCLGQATGLVEQLTDHEKEYLAGAELGIITDTQDATGTVTGRVPEETVLSILGPDPARTLEEAIEPFRGGYEQLPPMYSAVKINGQKLYDLARKGREVERKTRSVRIDGIELLKTEGTGFSIRVTCGKGTYIRTLIHDIGGRLSCGAVMTSLLRTRVGQFTLDSAVKLSEVEAWMEKGAEEVRAHLIPIDDFYKELRPVSVPDELLKYLENGNPFSAKDLGEVFSPGERIRMYDSRQRFYAVYAANERGTRCRPERVFFISQ